MLFFHDFQSVFRHLQVGIWTQWPNMNGGNNKEFIKDVGNLTDLSLIKHSGDLFTQVMKIWFKIRSLRKIN